MIIRKEVDYLCIQSHSTPFPAQMFSSYNPLKKPKQTKSPTSCEMDYVHVKYVQCLFGTQALTLFVPVKKTPSSGSRGKLDSSRWMLGGGGPFYKVLYQQQQHQRQQVLA